MPEEIVTPPDECGNCRFWKSIKPATGIGLCRKYAPNPVAQIEYDIGDNSIKTPAVYRWPRVFDEDWCGEHEGLKPAELSTSKQIGF